MRGLLSDRFLNRFAGKRKSRRSPPPTQQEKKEQETDSEKIGGAPDQEPTNNHGKEDRPPGQDDTDIKEINCLNEPVSISPLSARSV